MIEISELVFRYTEGEFALRVPQLSVERRERTAIIGPSGCGKTTLLNLMAGIQVPQAGRVVTGGVEVNRLGDTERRVFRVRKIGLVFQEFELLDYLNVLDNVLLPYRINSALTLDRQARERAHELADRVGIGNKLGRNVNHLSQGERQRAAVCRALVTEPELVLADEPTGNLDPTNKDRVLDILLDCIAASDATLVTVTHDHELLGRFDRVIDFREFYDIPTAHAAAQTESESDEREVPS